MIMLLSDSISSLRQSCDRCHRRKQRCTRSGAQDNKPCRRCQEAGEKCVYSPPLRSGRPKTRKLKEGKPKENEAGRATRCLNLPTSCSAEGASGVRSLSNADPMFIANNTISTLSLATGDSDTSGSDCTTATASNTLPTLSEESVDLWLSPGDCNLDAHRSIVTPNLLYGTSTHAIDGPWSEILGREWQSDTVSGFELKQPPISTGITSINSAPDKDDHHDKHVIDPIPLLSQINLQLHAIEIPKTAQCGDWKTTLDRGIQTTQSFIQVLNKLLPETFETSPIIFTRDKWQVSRPAFLNVENLSKDDLSSTGFDECMNPVQENTSGLCIQKVDTIVLRLALVCYMQIIRSYKCMTVMLDHALEWAAMHPAEELNLLPIRIGTLQAAVSPKLHISMLIQLINDHSEELCDKMRRLASRTVDNNSQTGPDHSGTLLRDLIGVDVCSEEKGLRIGLDLITAKLRNIYLIPI